MLLLLLQLLLLLLPRRRRAWQGGAPCLRAFLRPQCAPLWRWPASSGPTRSPRLAAAAARGSQTPAPGA